MKNLLFAGLIVMCGIYLTSCKEEVGPTLTITALDTLGAPVALANIITHPCYFDSSSCDVARLNPNFHKERLSNAAGQATFEYRYSAVLDVVAVLAITNTGGDTVDVMYGQTVVALESKELKKKDKNEYEAKVVIDKFVR